jgi:hypothetical protein
MRSPSTRNPTSQYSRGRLMLGLKMAGMITRQVLLALTLIFLLLMRAFRPRTINPGLAHATFFKTMSVYKMVRTQNLLAPQLIFVLFNPSLGQVSFLTMLVCLDLLQTPHPQTITSLKPGLMQQTMNQFSFSLMVGIMTIQKSYLVTLLQMAMLWLSTKYPVLIILVGTST